MKSIQNKLMLLVITLTLAGCGSIFGPVSHRKITSYEIYDGDVSPSDLTCKKPHSQAIVFISPMHAYAPYDTYKMYYSESKYEMNSFAYSQWIALPTDMLTQAMNKKIFDSCLFRNLVVSNGLADANYRIISLLVSLRQEINTSDNSAVVHMVIATELVDLNDNKVIASKVFNEQLPTAVGPRGYVDGINQLTSKFNSELVSWLQQNT